MGTITTRQKADGSAAYLAQITIKRAGQIVHREAKSFDRKPTATSWIRRREKELKQPGAALAAAATKREEKDEFNPTLSVAIEDYLTSSRKKIGKTKAQVLATIQKSHIGRQRCRSIGSKEIVAYLEELADGRHPSTVGNYLSHLGSIFAVARPAWGYHLDSQAIEDARVVASRLGLIAKSDKRTRRHTLDELGRILSHLNSRQRTTTPMANIVLFAIFSTRRLEEITRIAWADYEPTNKRILVRDMKHPGQKQGNDVWVDLPAEAMEVIEMMPREGELIFPYNGESISTAFARACKFLDIDDLRFHDLRHDGVSRLFELGYSIPNAALVSGHRSWSSLQRYTHIRQAGDKYGNWPWRSYLSAIASNVIRLRA